MKIIKRFDLDVDGRDGCSQIAILPHIDFWWDDDSSKMISIGWLFWSIEFWFGKNIQDVK